MPADLPPKLFHELKDKYQKEGHNLWQGLSCEIAWSRIVTGDPLLMNPVFGGFDEVEMDAPADFKGSQIRQPQRDFRAEALQSFACDFIHQTRAKLIEDVAKLKLETVINGHKATWRDHRKQVLRVIEEIEPLVVSFPIFKKYVQAFKAKEYYEPTRMRGQLRQLTESHFADANKLASLPYDQFLLRWRDLTTCLEESHGEIATTAPHGLRHGGRS